MRDLTQRDHRPTRSAPGRARLRRRLVAALGVGTLVSVALVTGAGSAWAGGGNGNNQATPDDSRASVGQGNIGQGPVDDVCPANMSLLLSSASPPKGTTTGTGAGAGITATVTTTAGPTPDPYLTVPAAPPPVNSLPDNTQYVTVTLPANSTLSGYIYVKGGDGYNQYSGSDLTLLIPPLNGGGNIPAISHFLICGTLSQPEWITVIRVSSPTGSNNTSTVVI